MDKRYIQPYANAQLNAFIPVQLKAEGRLAWKMTFNETDIPGGTQFLYLLDNRRAVVDFGLALFCISLDRQKTLNFYRKSANAFIKVSESPWFYYVNSFRLMHAEFDRVNEDEDGFFIPGLGEYSQLHCLYLEKETFVAGVQNQGAPEYPVPSFEIYRKKYDAIDYVWRQQLPGAVLLPPVTETGQVIIACGDTVSVLNGEGKLKKIIHDKFTVLSASIGPENLLYLVVDTETGSKLRVYDFFGELQWEKAVDIAEPLQPPMVNDAGMVYLIGKENVTAYHETKKTWTYPILSGHPAATAVADGRMVLTDGRRIICLDEIGNEIWVYEDKEGENFVTPPVIDEQGQVLAASDNKIIMLK